MRATAYTQNELQECVDVLEILWSKVYSNLDTLVKLSETGRAKLRPFPPSLPSRRGVGDRVGLALDKQESESTVECMSASDARDLLTDFYYQPSYDAGLLELLF